MSAITITSEQRDALYEEIFAGLPGIGDVWLEASEANYEKTAELGRNFSDDLRLLDTDLGWGDGDGVSVELTTPPDVLRRVLGRLRESAALHGARADAELERVRKDQNHGRLVMETCDSVLADLESVEAR